MFLKKLLILSSVLLCSLKSSCQNGAFQLYQNGYYIKQYSELTGLVNNRCKYSFEDSKGFLWISTFQGLSRFDGQHFVNYGLKEGLPSSNISQVVEDADGFIYVATAKGIVRYTGRQSKSDTCFYIYRQTTDLGSPISGMQVIDSSTIVFQRIGSGLYLLRKNKLTILCNEILNFEMSVLKDRNNNIYAYTKDTFHIYDKNFAFVRKIPFPSSYFMTFYYDNISNIIHTYADSKSYRLNAAGLDYAGPAPDSIIWFWKDRTADRIYYSKERTDLFINDDNVKTKILDMGSLSLFSNDLRQTKDKTVWVTTNAGGILKVNPLPYYEEKIATAVSIEIINNSHIIVTDNPMLAASAPGEPANSLVRVVFIDKSQTIWYCTGTGIYKRVKGKNMEHYSFSGNEALFGPSAKEVKNVMGDEKGNLWFYGYCGLVRYSNGAFKQYTARNGLNRDALVRQLAIEKDGTVLAADWYNLYRVKDDTLIKIDKELGLRNYIPNKIVTDNTGSVWLDYNNKIFKVEKNGKGNYLITDSIIPNTVISATEITNFSFDGKNNCWIGYNGGRIQVFFNGNGRYSNAESITYTIGDGLAPVSGSEYAFYKNRNGDMTVVNGKSDAHHLFVFPLESALERKKMSSPQVCITDMLVNQSIPDWAALGYRTDPYGLPGYPKFNFKNNDLTFNYTATSLRNPEGVIYRVMLKGYNDDWIATTQTAANYTNLPPGDYCFMVKASNVNGVWGYPGTFNFTILKPWYKTWWALSLWSILFISLILFLFYARLKAVRKEDYLTNLKKSNEFKATLIALLGHDIIIPLQYIGKVAAQLKTYSQKLSKETITESLGEISITASQLQLFGESVVHWIKIQNSEFDPFLNQPFSTDEIFNELISFHSTVFNQKGNMITKESDPALRFSQDPFLVKTILHNLLLNANKFTSNGTIKLKAAIENNRLSLSISDSGKGMSPERTASLNNFKPLDSKPGTDQEKGWGLGYTIILDLLKFSKGTLHVESKLNEGTTITITLPSKS
jgi:signal transduction histidine kinase